MLQLYPLSADTAPHSRVVPSFACLSSMGFAATWVRASGELDVAAAPLLAGALLNAQRSARLVAPPVRRSVSVLAL
jgi:hypothetical protein